jgi:hypothetical protein
LAFVTSDACLIATTLAFDAELMHENCQLFDAPGSPLSYCCSAGYPESADFRPFQL